MHIKDISKSGNPKTLFSAFLYFDMSFMIWVILGALGNSIAEEFHLSAGQKGLMIGLPSLSGAVLRLLLGALADRIGGSQTGLLGPFPCLLAQVVDCLATHRFDLRR